MNGRNSKGFTLLEMLISIAIVAMVAITVFQLNSNAIRQQQRLEDFTVGHMILMNTVEQYKLDMRLGSQEVRTEERIRIVHQDKEYEINITRTDDDVEGLDRVEFVLSSVDPFNDSLHSLEAITTYMLRDSQVQTPPVLIE